MKKQLRLLLPVMLLVGAQVNASTFKNWYNQTAFAKKLSDMDEQGRLQREYDLDTKEGLHELNQQNLNKVEGLYDLEQQRLNELEGLYDINKPTMFGRAYDKAAGVVSGASDLTKRSASAAFDAIGMGYDKMKGAMTATVDAVNSGFATANAYLSPKFKAMGQTLLSSTDATFAWINQDRTHQAGSIAALVAVASGLGYVYRENLKAALKKVKASILGKEKLVKEDIALLAELEKHASKLEEPKPVVKEQVVQTPEPEVAAEVSAPVKKPSSRRRR